MQCGRTLWLAGLSIATGGIAGLRSEVLPGFRFLKSIKGGIASVLPIESS